MDFQQYKISLLAMISSVIVSAVAGLFFYSRGNYFLMTLFAATAVVLQSRVNKHIGQRYSSSETSMIKITRQKCIGFVLLSLSLLWIILSSTIFHGDSGGDVVLIVAIIALLLIYTGVFLLLGSSIFSLVEAARAFLHEKRK